MKTNIKLSIVLVFSVFFSARSFAQAIKVNPSGTVGICGNPNDSYKLTVNGTGYYTGTLRSGNIGINAAPSATYELYVSGDGYFTTSCRTPSAGYVSTGSLVNVSSIYNSTAYGRMEFLSDNVTALKIYGGTETTKTLDISGQLWVNGSQVIGSDERLKKDIAPIEGMTILEKIKNIEGKKYKFKNSGEMLELHNSGQAHFEIDTINLYEEAYGLAVRDADFAPATKDMEGTEIKQLLSSKYFENAKKSLGIERTVNDSLGILVRVPRYNEKETFGFLAQNIIEAGFGELVEMDSVSGLYGVNYDGFIPILLEAIKSQQQQIDELKRALEVISQK